MARRLPKNGVVKTAKHAYRVGFTLGHLNDRLALDDTVKQSELRHKAHGQISERFWHHYFRGYDRGVALSSRRRWLAEDAARDRRRELKAIADKLRQVTADQVGYSTTKTTEVRDA